MAHKAAGGSTALGRDSKSQRLGVKKYAGEFAKAGTIIIRQRGTHYHPGINTRKGSDDTIFSTATGKINFKHKKAKNFTGKLTKRTFVNVEPVAEKQ